MDMTTHSQHCIKDLWPHSSDTSWILTHIHTFTHALIPHAHTQMRVRTKTYVHKLAKLTLNSISAPTPIYSNRVLWSEYSQWYDRGLLCVVNISHYSCSATHIYSSWQTQCSVLSSQGSQITLPCFNSYFTMSPCAHHIVPLRVYECHSPIH